MKLYCSIFYISMLYSVIGFAEAPRKEPAVRYRPLWNNSLITEKPLVKVADEEVVTPLDDYTLGGFTKTGQGYLISLINSKDPKGRLTLAPGMPGYSDYEVLQVENDTLDYTKSRILLKVGNKKKWLSFEKKHLALKQPPPTQNRSNPKQVNPPIPGLNQNNNAANNTKPTTRRTRVRRVPTPPKK